MTIILNAHTLFAQRASEAQKREMRVHAPETRKGEVILEDTFINNSAGRWAEGLFANTTIQKIERGVFSFSRTATSGGFTTLCSMPMEKFSMQQDFDIRAVITQKAGIEDNGFGIVFAAKDANNFSSFLVSSNGYFMVEAMTNGSSSSIVRWAQHSALQSLGTPMRLMVRKRGAAVGFFVNDVCVASTDWNSITEHGNNIGFRINRTMDIEIDEVSIVQYPSTLLKSAEQTKRQENLGENVNSRYTDYVPVISPDGATLWFSRKGDPMNVGRKDYQDIWFSTLQKNGAWSPASNPGAPLNNDGHNSVISISPDNNSLLVSNTYTADGRPEGGGISESRRIGSGWTIPQAVNISNWYNFNQYVTYCLTPDNRALIASCERNDTFGDTDLYIAFRQEDGSFGEPQNMGITINTFGSEFAPFVAADNETLYFSSNVHAGYGAADIFMVRRLDSTWTKWSAPVNLGTAVNTPRFDAYFSIPASGNYAYMVTAFETLGDLDIVRLVPDDAIRPKPVVLVGGRVLNARTREPISAKIIYENLQTARNAGTAISNPNDGSYKLSLPGGTLYGFYAKADGFYPVSEQFDTRSLARYAEVARDLLLEPIDTAKAIRLNNLFFDTGKFELRSESFPELDRLATFLQDNPKYMVELLGHTDNVGTDQTNKTLSQNRANAVRDYLAKKGVATARMRAVGYGKTKSVETNDTEEGKQLNRRVEFMLMNGASSTPKGNQGNKR